MFKRLRKNFFTNAGQKEEQRITEANKWHTFIQALPQELKDEVSYHLDAYDNLNLALVSKEFHSFFIFSLQQKKLLTRALFAIYYGKEELAAEIIGTNPKVLFERATYKVPLLDKDGKLSTAN